MRVGVLGGMGPYATNMFLDNILNEAHAVKESDHVHLVVDYAIDIPPRILGATPSPAQGMIDACRRLEKYPVDVIALPCNSATYWLPEVQPHIGIPILNIVDITCSVVGDAEKVLSLGGAVTYHTNLYGNRLRDRHIRIDGSEQSIVDSLIQTVKLYNWLDGAAYGFVDGLFKKYGVDKVIFACTELSLMKERYHCIDSSTEYARYIAQNYGGK